MSYVWLAEESNGRNPDIFGVFSNFEQAVSVCQDSANEFYGARNTAPLKWLGNEGYSSASYHNPVGGNLLFQVTRFVVDQVREP